MIRAIIFDCFGVLYRDNVSILYDLVAQDKQQGLRDIIHAADHGAISRDEYFSLVAELSGKTVEEVQAVDARQFSRNDNLVAQIRPLREHYKIGLLSNVGEKIMDTLFPEPERSELFDSFVLSSQLGIIKPNPEIFLHAATDLGMLPEECLMIDDLPPNIEGAQLAGLQGMVYSNNHDIMMQIQQLTDTNNA